MFTREECKVLYLMDSEASNILNIRAVDKREVNLKSSNTEREVFKRSMEYLISRGIKITEVSQMPPLQ